MSYDLRRLRLHGIIERIEVTHRYRLTAAGRKLPSSTPGSISEHFGRLSPTSTPKSNPHPIQQTFHKLQRQIDDYYADKIAA